MHATTLAAPESLAQQEQRINAPPELREASAPGAPTPSSIRGPVERTAVLVCHGMGQQMPFETVNLVAERLIRAEVQRTGGGDPQAGVRIAQLTPDGDPLPRVELTVTPAAVTAEADGANTPDGSTPDATDERRSRAVHLYEVYWAPMTEGKVGDGDVLWFMITAGLNGVRRAPQRFKKVMLDAVATFEAGGVALLAQFAWALAIFGALLAIHWTIVTMAGARLVLGAAGGAGGTAGAWPSNALVEDLSIDLALLLIGPVLLLVVCVKGPARWRRRSNPNDTRQGAPPWRLSPFVAGLLMAGVHVALASLVLVALLMLGHLALHQLGRESTTWSRLGVTSAWLPAPFAPLAVAILWGGAGLVVRKGRWFFRQYLGDVAAYISPQALDRFFELRRDIKAHALKIGRAVYEARDPQTGGWLYGSVSIVGHSLGSVVAYDLLNGLLKADQIGGGTLRVAERTELLLTFGSPLDKTAYVFGTRHPDAFDVQDGLEAISQPLIAKYAHRPRRWANIWSRNDPISGDLTYYDWPADEKDEPDSVKRARRVANIQDEEATTPLEAHNEYWTGRAFIRELDAAVRAPLPAVAVPGMLVGA